MNACKICPAFRFGKGIDNDRNSRHAIPCDEHTRFYIVAFEFWYAKQFLFLKKARSFPNAIGNVSVGRISGGGYKSLR